MTRHRTRIRAGLAASAAGTVAGVLGLTLIAVPADAGAAPALPDVGAAELVSSALTAQPPAMRGTVTVDNELGLPALPGSGGGGMLAGDLTARVWWDGHDHRARVALPGDSGPHASGGTTVLINDGDTLWVYDSADRTAIKAAAPESAEHERPSPAAVTEQVQQLLNRIRQSSTVRVDGTATVAGREAYELVLTPKPSERTLLRSVRVAVDAKTRIPLRLEVYASDQSEPALSIGFTELHVGPQPDRLFEFTPPDGVTVKKASQVDHPVGPSLGLGMDSLRANLRDVRIVGQGWDTVVAGRLPAGQRPHGPLARLGHPVSGAWGSGQVISTAVGSALLTDDGRLAFGAVPVPVLVEAVGNMR